MSISEQVRELRIVAETCNQIGKQAMSKYLFEAADTIEALFAKVVTNDDLGKMILDGIRKEIKEKETIWRELENPPYSEFEQELYLSGLRKAREIILSAANMERSEDCGGWIYCGDGKNMPEEHNSIFKPFKGTEKWKQAMFETTSNEVEVTVEFEDGTRKTMTAHTLDGKWKVDTFVKNKVISWKPFSEPYHEP